MEGSTPGQAARRHRLLPHERWLADLGARKGAAPQGSDRWRLQQNYGPEGVALLIAASADGFLGGLIGFTGLALLFATGGSAIGYYLLGIGVLISLAGLARALQCARAGRLYRNGRPFVRART